jgi:hypothetical protein
MHSRESKLAALLPRLPIPLFALLIAVSAAQASCGGMVDSEGPDGSGGNVVDAGALDADARVDARADADASEDSPEDRADGMSYGDGYQP